jgi:hypothetical protein
MKNLASILFLAVLIMPGICEGQDQFWNSSSAYLGQPLPNDTPQIFAQELLTIKDTVALDRVAFSKDGKEFYYSSSNAWYDNKSVKIRHYRYHGGKWLGPYVVNKGYYAPTFSIDGSSLYLLGGKPDSLHSIVWRIKRIKDGWTVPEIHLRRTYGLYDFMPTSSGAAYVGSNVNGGDRKDFNSYDICLLQSDKNSNTIKSLGAPLNTPGFDGDFYVAPNESYIIISAKETKDFESELHISFHKNDGKWTVPVSLGPLINNGLAHRWGQYVSPDGKYLFYTQGTNIKDCHIYWVRFDKLISKLREEQTKEALIN